MYVDEHLPTSSAAMMPRLIYGTAWKKYLTADLVEQAVKAGFTGIDTACQPKHYLESGVGEALQRLQTQGINREALYIQTKFTPLAGQDPDQIPYDKDARSATQVAQSFEVSKKNLQTDYVDALLLHSPLFPFAESMRVYRAMEIIHDNGQALRLGISNCYDLGVLRRLHEEASIKPTIVQNRFYADSGYDSVLRRWCDDHGITYQSFWTLTANPHILGSRALFDLARKYGKSEAQVLFRYLSHIGIVPLTGTTSLQHMVQDLEIFDIDLTSDEIEKVTRLLV